MPIDYFISAFVSRGGNQLVGELNRIAAGYGAVETAAMRGTRIGGAYVAAGAVGLVAMNNLAKGALQAAGEVSRVEVGYRTILKNEQKVRELSKSVRDFDVKSPFSYLDSARGSQQLLAAGFRGKQLMDTMYGVGNAVVSAGKGSETFIRLLAVMAKIQSQGILTAVRVNQFAAAGVNVKDILKEKLGLTDEQMINIGRLKLKADIVIPAITEGLNQKFAGGLEKANKQYLGALETLQGSQDKFKASIGKTIEKDAVRGIKAFTALTDAASEWTAAHPRMTKAGLYAGGATSAGLMALGLMKVKAAAKLTGSALKGLSALTATDIALERTKTGVASKESLARIAAATATGKQSAALRTLAARNTAASLAPIGAAARYTRTALPPMSADPVATGAGAGVGARIAGARAAGAVMGTAFVSRTKSFLRQPLIGKGALNEMRMGARSQGMALRDTGYGKFWMRTTNGTALGAAAGGLTAGAALYDTYSNQKNQQAVASMTGYHPGEGAATGLAAAGGLALGAGLIFAPQFTIPAIALIGIAKAIEMGFSKVSFQPQEKAAEQGSGADNKDLNGPTLGARMMAAQRAVNAAPTREAYDKQYALLVEQSRNAQLAGDDDTARAIGYRMMQNRKDREKTKLPGTIDSDIDQYTASVNATSEANKEQKISAFIAARKAPGATSVYARPGEATDAEGDRIAAENERLYGGKANARELAAVRKTQISMSDGNRSGGRTIEIRHTVTIPDSQAEQNARRRRSNTMTPSSY